jgi:chromosome segregation ATPase
MKKQQIEETPIAASLFDQIGEAEDELSRLQAEENSLSGIIRRAAEDADTEALFAARERQAVIGTHIKAARIRQLRLKIARFESEGEVARQEYARAAQALEPAQEALSKAQAAYDSAACAYANAQASVYDRAGDRAAMRRELSELTVDFQNAAVVRPRLRAA